MHKCKNISVVGQMSFYIVTLASSFLINGIELSKFEVCYS